MSELIRGWFVFGRYDSQVEAFRPEYVQETGCTPASLRYSDGDVYGPYPSREEAEQNRRRLEDKYDSDVAFAS